MEIKGLTYIPDFITWAQHNYLIEKIDCEHWSTELKRRVQHYGYKYDYKLRKIDGSMRIAAFPGWLEVIAQQLAKENIFKTIPDQAIINEYMPGQGISNHTDCEPCFENTIVSLSLFSPCVMNLTKDNIIVPFLLMPKSIIILEDEARYEWYHGIKSVKTDTYHNLQIKRQRRISITFRKVILN